MRAPYEECMQSCSLRHCTQIIILNPINTKKNELNIQSRNLEQEQ